MPCGIILPTLKLGCSQTAGKHPPRNTETTTPAHNTPKRPAATQPLPTYGPLKIRSLSDLTRNQLEDVVVVLANRLTFMHPDTAQGLLNNPKLLTDSTYIDYQAVASALALSAGPHTKRGA